MLAGSQTWRWASQKTQECLLVCEDGVIEFLLQCECEGPLGESLRGEQASGLGWWVGVATEMLLQGTRQQLRAQGRGL